MHINYVMWGVARTGGTVTFTEIGKRLIKKGHKVTITAFDDGYGHKTPQGYKPDWEKTIPIEYIPVDLGVKYWRFLIDTLVRVLKPHAMAAEWEKIYKMVDHIPDCDINIATYFPSAFSLYFSHKGKKQFYHMQHFEPLFYDPEVPFDSPNKYVKLAVKMTEPIAPMALETTAMSRLAELSYMLPINKIANSLWLKNMIKEKYGADSYLINHAIRNEIFYPRDDVSKPARKRVLSLGKSSMFWKGTGTLADAMKIVVKKHPDVELVFYGVEKNPSIDFPHKYIYSPSFNDLARLYCSSHVVVCPSWYESFPAPPLEGMSCGVPVVTTSIGVEDYARDGENSLVVPPRNAEAMADAICRILGDEELCKKLSKNGLETASQFSWDKTTDNLEKLFEKVLHEKE